MRKELTGFGDVLKKIKNYCDPFVIVTGHALALPPLLFYRNTMLCVYHKPGCKRFLCSYVNDNRLQHVVSVQHVSFMQQVWCVYVTYIRVVFLPHKRLVLCKHSAFMHC